MTDSKFNVPTWLNSVLITILMVVAGASFFQNKQTNKTVQTLEVSVAVLTTKIDGFNVADKTNRINEIEKTFVTEEQIQTYFAGLREWIDANYEKKK